MDACQSINWEAVIAFFSLIVSVLAVPITYRLGRRSIKYDFINLKIDELSSTLDQIYKDSLIVSSSSNAQSIDMNMYYSQIGNHVKLNNIVKQLVVHDLTINSKEVKKHLLEIKKISTGDIFEPANKNQALNKLLKLSYQIQDEFKRKF